MVVAAAVRKEGRRRRQEGEGGGGKRQQGMDMWFRCQFKEVHYIVVSTVQFTLLLI